MFLVSAFKDLIETNSKPRFLRFRSSTPFLIFVISMAVFADIFLYAVIIPVVPFSLEERINLPPEKTQTYVTALIAAYGGSLALTSPLFGWLADRTQTRRAPFLIGLMILLGATVMMHLGRSFALLVTARILQGASASVVWIVGLSLMADTVPAAKIGWAMGFVYLAMSMGLLMGPLLGGIVFSQAGYDAVFYLSYAVVAVDILLRLVAVEKKVARRWLDAEELELESEEASLEDGTRGEEEVTTKDDSGKANTTAADTPQTVTGGSNPPATATAPREQLTRQPSTIAGHRIPPVLTLLKSRRLLAALWGSVVLATLLTSLDTILPLYVASTFGWSSLGAGLLFLAIVVPSFLGPLVGFASDRFGAKWIATGGFVLAIPVEVLLRFVTKNTIGHKILLVALLALLGLATDMIITPIMADITLIVDLKSVDGRLGKKGAYAQAYGLFNFAFALGCMIGPFFAGFIKEAAGWGTVTWALGLLSAVSVVPTAVWCGGRIGKTRVD